MTIEVLLNRLKQFCISNKPEIIFIVLLISLAVVYDYPSIAFKRPQSVHRWRQSDCASLTLNYYQTGMNFFQPQVHNLTSDKNTTGYCAPSEIPLQYYFIASLYKVFGYHDFIYRITNTLIFLLGLFYLFRLFKLLIEDVFWSMVFVLLFFTSPVLVYYGNNFLTDSSGLAFSLIGLYYFIRYLYTKNFFTFSLSIFFYFLAGASKITALISLVAILIIFIIELIGYKKLNRGGGIFTNPELNFICIATVFILVGLWVYYAKKYNLNHSSGYFSTTTFPIWDLNSDEIKKVLDNIKGLWLNQYFHVYTLYFFLSLFVITILFIKKTLPVLMILQILLLTGTGLYSMLWFWTFKDHDYYTINLYILFIVVLLNFSLLVKQSFPQVYNSHISKFIFICFLLFNVNHARTEMKECYLGWWNEYPEYKDYHSISPYLRSIGIKQLDTVICLPDISHFTLYLMNQRGWTECLGNNMDSTSIATSISKGADYLIVNGEEILKKPYLQSFLTNQIGVYHQIKIFKLNSSE